MQRIYVAPAVIALLLLLNGCDIDLMGEQFQSDFHYSYPLQPGGRLTLETFNGSVEVSPWDQNTVDISGVKYASKSDMRDDIKIEIDHTPTSVSIRAVRPFSRHGSMGARFILRVPRHVELDHITSSNGAIRISDIEGAARLKTSNGSIHMDRLNGSLNAQTNNAAIEAVEVHGSAVLHTSNGHIRGESISGPVDATTSNSSVSLVLRPEAANGPLHLSTSNGSIDVTLEAAPHSEIRAHTSNGAITMRLPEGAGAHLHAETSNSSIATDFPVTMQGSFSKNRLEGDLGKGGPLLDLTSSNGHIRVLRAAAN